MSSPPPFQDLSGAQKEKIAGYALEELTISIISNSYVLNLSSSKAYH